MTTSIEDRLKTLIVETLALDDVTPAQIDSEAPLFVEGLGLDSIDALEIAIAVHQEFGVKTDASDENNRKNFHSIASLAAFIRTAQSETDDNAS